MFVNFPGVPVVKNQPAVYILTVVRLPGLTGGPDLRFGFP